MIDRYVSHQISAKFLVTIEDCVDNDLVRSALGLPKGSIVTNAQLTEYADGVLNRVCWSIEERLPITEISVEILEADTLFEDKVWVSEERLSLTPFLDAGKSNVVSFDLAKARRG